MVQGTAAHLDIETDPPLALPRIEDLHRRGNHEILHLAPVLRHAGRHQVGLQGGPTLSLLHGGHNGGWVPRQSMMAGTAIIKGDVP